MKLNDNFSNKNDFIYLNKFDFSKNDSFGLPNQSKNSKNNKEYNKNYNESNADPRLELTLKYLDIISTLQTFITNNIFFNDLLLLSKNDLVELGFSLVERNRILHFSQEFKKYGKKYSIQEINNFFNEFQNLNMRLITINNNMQSFPTNEEKEITNNINNERLNNNQKSNFNYLNYDIKNTSNIPNNDSLYLEDKPYPINHNNDFYPKSNIFPGKYNNNNKNQLNKNNYNFQNNDIKIKNNYLALNKIKSKNIKPEQKYQESINSNSNINNNNINNHNYYNNYKEIESSKLIRQNSKASKTSSYSKNSKSRLVTLSKNFLPPASSSGSIVQKYQNLSEEIDNYFKKYNNYKENKKNKMKKYQIITSSNNSKKNYNPIFINNKNFMDKKKNNNSINNVSNFNNNYKENDMNDNINNEISQKLQELQKKKKELKEKLNTVCDNENTKKIIVKYLEEEENK